MEFIAAAVAICNYIKSALLLLSLTAAHFVSLTPSVCGQTHQRLSHDDADLVFRGGGEISKQAFEDVLARFTLRVDADRHHCLGFLLFLGPADWMDRGFVSVISVPHR